MSHVGAHLFTWPPVSAGVSPGTAWSQPVPAARLVEQVGVIGGAHAQVMAAAELSLGLRVDRRHPAGRAPRRCGRTAPW